MLFNKPEIYGISINELKSLEQLSLEITPFLTCKPTSKCVAIKKKLIEEELINTHFKGRRQKAESGIFPNHKIWEI